MKIGIILLGRMGSTRLPGKVMLELCGKPVLEHIIDRLSKVNAKPLIVATSTKKQDDLIIELCQRKNIAFFRGSENNVLDRCIKAAKAYKLDAFVRLGADNPFVDWEIINRLLYIFLKEYNNGNHIEYLSNCMQRSFPLGLDVEIMTKDVLLKVEKKIRPLPDDQRKLNEINVIPYIHQNCDQFNTFSYHEDFDHSHLRWTLDTPEDFELIKKVYIELYYKNSEFLMKDILALFEKNPELSHINAEVIPKSGFWTKTEKQKLTKRIKI